MAFNYGVKHNVNDKLLTKLIELDESVYNDIYKGSFSLCKNWISKNNKIYTILKHKKNVVGYINFAPVTKECYDGFIKGEIRDYDFNDSHIIPFSKKTDNKCVLISVVVKKEYQDGLAIKILMKSFLKKLKRFEKKKIKISDIALDCVSEDSEKFAKNFLKADVILKMDSGKIYKTTYNSIVK